MGIGRRLKAYQNQWAQAQGYDRMVWTFDPMRATNAYFNLHVLGASVVAYRPNYYGVLQSRLNGGLPTDRWICVWPVPAWPGPPDVGPSPWRIEIPPDIGRLKQVDAEAAAQWQARVRSDVEEAFAAGYRVVDFIRTPHPAYLLTQERSPPSRA
jgi:predicted GNAT superfamily acetyltransferase